MLREGGRAAMVVPDNVLFEGGAGEKVRRELLHRCEVHTLLRLPTGIWYSSGVRANVLFFDKKPEKDLPATKEIWVYDLRTDHKFSLRQNPIRSEDLTNFIECYHADERTRRKESSRFRRFGYSDIMARNKANLDIQWQNDEMDAADDDNPRALMKMILEDLKDAMREFAA